MNRHKIRKTILYVSFLFFPATIFYFSPAIVIEGAYKGILVDSAAVFIILFLSSLFLGRAFCGWLCPGGGLQEMWSGVNRERARSGRLDLIKYLIWIPWVTIIGLSFNRAG